MNFEEKIRSKKGIDRIIMLTAYDCQMGKLLEEAGVDLILVGDSLGMVFQGNRDTKQVSMRDMIYHVKAVAKGAKNTPIVGDMPINSYSTAEEGLENAKRFLAAGADGVKIEGNPEGIAEALVKNDIPLMGHVGMLPQMAETYRVKGKTPEEAEKIYGDASSLDKLGVFSIVLECIPESLAKRITERLLTPTIGIGAGKYCDGQVLVINDMLGLDQSFKPKFVKRFADLHSIVKESVTKFREEVNKGVYPDDEHTYH